ncbi:MAG: hypothetical protein IPI90_05465 [Saprospiraceae bacterium]|nr:hypothetical protein [Candidatus Vicinibacter affinis]
MFLLEDNDMAYGTSWNDMAQVANLRQQWYDVAQVANLRQQREIMIWHKL